MARSNKILFRVVLALLCVTLLSTSVMSTTFAKYTASGQSSSSARVATWGGSISGDNEENVIKIKPGQEGYIVRATTSGPSEVLHVATLSSIDLKMDLGYKNIAAGEDYFPLLLTVGIKKGATTVEEKHFYMTMTSSQTGQPITTIDGLTAEIAAYGGELSQYIEPNESATVEFYVKWRWFYNDKEIDDSTGLDDTIKTAMKAYQTPEKDTLIGEAMRVRAAFNEIINADGNDAKYTTLKNLLAEYKDVVEPTEAQVTALSNALADFFGETPTSYTYKKTETYDIRWTGVRNSKYMTCYDPNTTKITSYGGYFTTTTTNESITSKANSNANVDGLELFFRSVPERDTNRNIVANGATIPLREGFLYEYYFKARNNRDLLASSQGIGSAGVVFAIDEDDVPYFLYGEFTNNSDLGINKGAQLGVRYGTWESDLQNGTEESSAMVKTETIGGLEYGVYKVEYNGFNVTCYWMAEDGTYKPIGNSFTLPAGSRISIGVESRMGYNSTERTVTVRDASFVQTKEVVSVNTVFNSLVKRAQSVVDACENGPFDVRVNLGVTMQQVQSKEDN